MLTVPPYDPGPSGSGPLDHGTGPLPSPAESTAGSASDGATDATDGAKDPGRAITPSDEITELLSKSSRGDTQARSQLYELVYPQLKEIATRVLRRSRKKAVQPTILVHEAFLKVAGKLDWTNRGHFMAVVAKAMRDFLVDNARRHKAQKRDHATGPISEPLLNVAIEGQRVEVLELNDALERLAEAYPRAARIVELRFFGGLSIEETARLVGASDSTVSREWSFARAWLLRRLS